MMLQNRQQQLLCCWTKINESLIKNQPPLVVKTLYMELDKINHIAEKAFEGYIVRKDLLEQFRKTYPVPTYVIEFLLGRYCATTDEQEIQEGLEIVKRQLQDRTVRPGEEEYFKSKAREKGSIKLIDIITAKLDAATDSYVATLPSLMLNKIR